MQILDASDSSVLVVFGDAISPELNREVVALFHALQKLSSSYLRNLHPAYASLLIDFDPLRITHAEVRGTVEQALSAAKTDVATESRVHEIPVCYGGEFGPDLGDVARHCGLSEDEVVRRHSGVEYMVYFLGFAPGFAYLGGLPTELATPRLETPRKSVPAGSIGIAGNQTGAYAIDSPGGWRLIGRTPVVLFDSTSNPPARLQAGHRVRFVSIGREAYDGMVQR